MPRDGVITSLFWSGAATAAADGGYARIELSFSNVAQGATSDTMNVISEVTIGGDLVTSGGPESVNVCHAGIAIPVKAGDRIYFNLTVASTTFYASCFIAISE